MAVTQPGMQAQDDLAALFSRNLVLDPGKVQQQQDQIPQPVPEPPQEAPQVIYSISQHYNHSSHIARAQQPQQIQRPASEPPRPERPVIEKILSSHGIDPSALSQAQLQLFKEADDAQKLRLLELWTICPPTNSLNNPTLAWNSTSLEQEERLARVRFEQQQQESAIAEQQAAAAAHGHDGPTMMSMDGTSVPVPFQGGDGRWLLEDSQHYMMEPYMSAGYESSSYEALARREYEASSTIDSPLQYKPAIDPVYKSVHSPVDWAMRQRMEDQYGAYTQCRMEFW